MQALTGFQNLGSNGALDNDFLEIFRMNADAQSSKLIPKLNRKMMTMMIENISIFSESEVLGAYLHRVGVYKNATDFPMLVV